jgi:hypothetical protein
MRRRLQPLPASGSIGPPAGLWPRAEAAAAHLDGRFLGSTRRRGDAANRRWLRQPDACRRLLDHLIDAPIERRPHFEAERLGGLEG